MENTTAIYVRVSTTEQSTDLQTHSLMTYAERANLNITHVFIDKGISGTKELRPELNRLMVSARNHEFKNVMVWKFDRFARSVSHLLKGLEEFNFLGVRFISVKDQVDTDSPMGKAMFSLVGVMAELEGDLIRERIKEGMKVAKAKGIKIGRPKVPDSVIKKIEKLACETSLSISKIHLEVGSKASRAFVGKVVKGVRG